MLPQRPVIQYADPCRGEEPGGKESIKKRLHEEENLWAKLGGIHDRSLLGFLDVGRGQDCQGNVAWRELVGKLAKLGMIAHEARIYWTYPQGVDRGYQLE